MAVEFLDEAQGEFRGATIWYAERSQDSAARFVESVEAAILRVSEYPRTGRPLGASFRRTPVRGFPFSLIYAVEPARILVIAVVHGSRRPGYWRTRRR